MHTLSVYIFQVGSTNKCMAEHVGAEHSLRAGAAVKSHQVELDI